MASNPNKVWGQTRIRINGVELAIAPKPTFQPGGVARAEQEADNRGGLFSESTKSSSIKFKVLMTAGVSLKWLQGLDDETVQVQLDTGRTYVMRHAWTSDAIEATDGGVDVTMMASPAEELL